ncbi:MAG: hypothetical protein GXP54_05600, partial [Deltaproteobacteria bacterium]|nr:hypothetical protein [Deltaproteobacteria bacterium]
SLNVLYYLKHMCGVRKVRKLVSLAGAFHGTVTACLDPLSCGTQEMCIGSKEGAWKENEALADLLQGDETPGDTLYTCIWSKYDEIIIPATGGKLEGAENIECQTPFTEHAGILMSDESYGYVREALLSGGLNEDGPGWSTIPDCAPESPPEAMPEPLDYPDDALAPDAAAFAETALETHCPDTASDGGAVTESQPEREDAFVSTGEQTTEIVVADASGGTDVWSHFPIAPEGACSAGRTGSPSVVWLILLSLVVIAIPRALRT